MISKKYKNKDFVGHTRARAVMSNLSFSLDIHPKPTFNLRV
jgi:hypothetical protein